MNLQKQPCWCSEKYIKWVCTQDCVVCGYPGHDGNQIVPHHLKGVANVSGAGLKAGDNWAMPMHVKCHNWFHAVVLKNWTGEINGIVVAVIDQPLWVARTLARAVEQGVLKV